MKQAPGPGSLGSLPNQRKAGYGLQRIPKTIYEWRDDVERYGLSNRTLSNICLQGALLVHRSVLFSNYRPSTGPFSASNVPATSFLAVRAVWPGRKPVEAALPALVTEGALCETDTKCAYNLLYGGALGLDKLEALMDLICTQARPSTPVRTIGSLADQLGPFAQLVSLHNLLVRRLPSLQQQQRKDSPRLFDAPRAPMDRRQGGDEGARTSPLVDLVHRRTDRADRRADGKGDNEKKLAVTHPGRNLTMTPSPTSLVSDSTCDNGDGQGNSELLIADNDDDGAAVADLPLPTPRNPTETVVVDFLVTFIAAIATLIQPPTRIPVCVADAFEQTLQFGPVPGTNKAAEAFRARTDGGIPLGSGKSMLPAIIFEAKSAKRGDNEVSVRAQQTMEHAAFIWEKAEESRKNAKVSSTSPLFLPPVNISLSRVRY